MDLVKEALWSSKSAKIQTLAIIVAVVVLAIVGNPAFSGAYTPLFLAWVLTYSVMAVAWTFFSGKTGYISLASTAFMGLGMYMQVMLGRDLPLAVTMILSALVAFAAAFGIGVITLRLRGVYFAIFTFGLALFLNKIIRWYVVTFTFTKGHMVKSFDNDIVFYAVLVVMAILLFSMILFNKSKFGLALDCIGQNEDSAQHMGVNTVFTKVMAFAISAAPVGAVGAVMSTTIGYVDPDIAFRIIASFFPVLMATFGGMYSLYGPIVGAVVFFSLQDYLLRKTDYYMIVFGVVMIVVITLMPKGIFGLLETVIAKKHRKYDWEVVGDA